MSILDALAKYVPEEAKDAERIIEGHAAAAARE